MKHSLFLAFLLMNSAHAMEFKISAVASGRIEKPSWTGGGCTAYPLAVQGAKRNAELFSRINTICAGQTIQISPFDGMDAGGVCNYKVFATYGCLEKETLGYGDLATEKPHENPVTGLGAIAYSEQTKITRLLIHKAVDLARNAAVKQMVNCKKAVYRMSEIRLEVREADLQVSVDYACLK